MGIEWAWLPPALSAGAFAGILLVGGRLPLKGAPLAVAAIAAGFALFWFFAADLVADGAGSFERLWFEAGDIGVSLGMTIDELAIVMIGLVTAVSLAVQVYSLAYMRGDPKLGWFFAVLALFAASMLALVVVDNLLVFYVLWELIGLCSYLLIGFYSERRSAAEAAKKAFIVTRVGDVALLIGVLVLFQAAGTFSMREIFALAEAGEIGTASLNLSAALIFIGVAGKSAQFPFHVWLPDAMEGPTPVSALIHAATLVIAGVYFLARLSPMLVHTPGVLDAVAAVGLFTAFIGAFLALAQNDLKRVLAYSTVSQLGFMVLAMGSFGFAAGIFHLLTHGFFKALLFLGSGSVMHAMDDELDMRKMGGLRRAMPVTFVLFAVGTFALAGLFPLSGFFSKDEILLGVLDGRNGWLLVVGLAASGLTALYAARMLFMVFAGEPRSDAARHAHEAGPLILVPMAALAIPAAGLGLLALSWGDFGGIGSFLHLPGGAHEYEINHAVFWPSLAVGFGLFAVGRFIYAPRGAEPAPSIVERRYPRLYAWVANKFYLDELYQWAVDNVVLAASRFIAVFDRRVVNDTGVDGPGKATVLAGRALRYHETGLIGTYILTIAVTAAAAIIIMVAVS